CLAATPASSLMWAHYARSHTGLCLEFDATMPEVSKAYEVKYAATRPLIRWQLLDNATGLIDAMLLTKSDDWKYEREYRILCRNGDIDKQPTTTLCKTNGDYLELSPNAIMRVIVGNRGDLTTVQEVVHRSRPDVGKNNGNVVKQKIHMNPGTGMLYQVFQYDGVNRLLKAGEYAAYQATVSCPDTTSKWCEQYAYDAWGTRGVVGRTG